MTYAEQFNAPSWLEEPAQWLWWAMQSRINGALNDSVYNLQQFWKTMEILKQTADETVWPEILALDSQSQIQSANTTGAIISKMTSDYNDYAFMFNIPYIGKAGEFVEAPKAEILAMQNQRTAALKKAEELANQARTAESDRVVAISEGRISQDEATRASENKQIEKILKNNVSDPLGVPIWAWLAGAVAVFVLLKVK